MLEKNCPQRPVVKCKHVKNSRETDLGFRGYWAEVGHETEVISDGVKEAQEAEVTK
jgi:hypothetical protein